MVVAAEWTKSPGFSRVAPFIMAEEKQRPSRPSRGSSPGAEGRPSVTSRFERFEKRQSELWRLTFVVLFFLVLAYAWTNWDAIRSTARSEERRVGKECRSRW